MQQLMLLGIGIVFGGLDVVPMMKQKLDRFSICSAFVFHMIMPWIVNGSAWQMDAWLKGGLVYALMAVPLAILAAKDDLKAAPIMVVTSLVLGCLCGAALSFVS